MRNSLKDLVVANWNLERPFPSSEKSKTLEEFFDSNSADIWFLTETHEQILPDKDFYSIFSENPDRKSQEGERWVGVWSRWEIEPLSELVTDKSRCTAGLINDSEFGPIVIYGVVLPWNSDPRIKGSTSFKVFDDAILNVEADLVKISELHPKVPIILAGDFNQSLASKHYYGSNAKRERLEKFLAHMGLVVLTSGSNDPVFRDSYPNACIDHICLSSSSGFNLVSTSRWPEAPSLKGAPSDHYQINVRLTHEI